MIDTQTEKLMEEVRSAEKFRDRHLERATELIETFSGANFDTSSGEESDLENHSFEFNSLVTPRIIYDNPRVRVRATIPELEEFAIKLQFALNRWAQDVDLRKTLLCIATDAAFSFGPFHVVNEPRLGEDPSEPKSQFLPRVYRLAPDQFGFDPRVAIFGDARFTFHRWVVDKEDLLKLAKEQPDAGWITKGIDSLAEQDLATKTWNSFRRSTDRVFDRGPGRKEVVAFDIWIPEIEHKDVKDLPPELRSKFHGSIYTLGESSERGSANEIRKPRPYYGPSWGPYGMAGYFIVPNDPMPLSPLVATFTQSKELNLNSMAMSRAARAYKKLLLVESDNPKLGQSIAADPDLFVVPIDFLANANLKSTEIGGITTQLIRHDEYLRERLDRNSGIDEARRGNPTGVSATEADIADRAGEVRLQFMKSQFAETVKRMLLTVAWYLIDESGVAGGSEMLDRLDLEIEPLSMSRPSETVIQQKALMETQLILQIAPAMLSMPHVDWRGVLRDLGDATGNPDLERRVSPEIAAQLLGFQMENDLAGAAPAGGGGSTNGARPSRAQPGSLPGQRRGAQRTAETKRKGS